MPRSAEAEPVPVIPHSQPCHYRADIMPPSAGMSARWSRADYSGRPASRRARFMKTSK
jgi:hypothetical protein